MMIGSSNESGLRKRNLWLLGSQLEVTVLCSLSRTRTRAIILRELYPIEQHPSYRVPHRMHSRGRDADV